MELERRVGVKENFFDSLRSEDDWSFVIKLHALFEAVCTHLLQFHFKEPNATEFFARIELSGNPIGKLSLLSQLKLISAENRKFITGLSELRNMLVHDVKTSEFDLAVYVSQLDSNQQKSFAIRFSPYETVLRKLSELPGLDGKTAPLPKSAELSELLKRARVDPKAHIWIGAYNALVSLVDMYSYSDYLQWEKAKVIIYEDEEDFLIEDGGST